MYHHGMQCAGFKIVLLQNRREGTTAHSSTQTVCTAEKIEVTNKQKQKKLPAAAEAAEATTTTTTTSTTISTRKETRSADPRTRTGG